MNQRNVECNRKPYDYQYQKYHIHMAPQFSENPRIFPIHSVISDLFNIESKTLFQPPSNCYKSNMIVLLTRQTSL